MDTTKKRGLRRYHIECGVSISGSYSKLTAKKFSTKMLRVRVQAPGQRRTVGYFIDQKFARPEVKQQLVIYGFVPGNYKRVIVTWGATDEAIKLAAKRKIEVWDFRCLLNEIGDAYREHRSYYTDDTARTIQLFAMASKFRIQSDRSPSRGK